MKKNKRLRQSVNTRLPFRKRRVIKWPGFFLCHQIAVCSLKRMPVMAEYHVIDFWQIHGREAKYPSHVGENKRQLFCQSVPLTFWFCS